MAEATQVNVLRLQISCKDVACLVAHVQPLLEEIKLAIRRGEGPMAKPESRPESACAIEFSITGLNVSVRGPLNESTLDLVSKALANAS